MPVAVSHRLLDDVWSLQGVPLNTWNRFFHARSPHRSSLVCSCLSKGTVVLVLVVFSSILVILYSSSSTSSSCSSTEKCSSLLGQGQLLDLVHGEVEVLGLV